MTQTTLPVKLSRKEALESAFFDLSLKDAFYANMLAEINILFSSKVPTAGMRWDKKREEFFIDLNEEFFCSLPFEQRVGVLSHEILHFAHGHLFRGSFTDPNATPDLIKMENIAADMSINQFIKHLPEGCIRVADYKTDKGVPFPLLKHWELYYELLKQNPTANKEQLDKYGVGGSGHDVHEWMEDGNPEDGSGDSSGGTASLSEDEKKEMLKAAANIFKRTMEKSSTSHTVIPQSVRDLLEKIETQIVGMNYKKILKDCIKKTISATDRENSWNRSNKRYGNYAPGTRCGRVPVVHFFIDTSGSISTVELNEFLSVVDGFLRVGSKKCKISFWHTSLYDTQNYRLGTRFDQKDIESGGTDVGPTVEFIKKNKPDLAIILTDGYFSQVDTKQVSGDIVWVISNNGSTNHPNRHLGKTIPLSGIMDKKK